MPIPKPRAGESKKDFVKRCMAKAKIACEKSGNAISDHFADVSKKVQLGSGAIKEIPDFMLTRYACYLIAQNGDPKKEQIAFAKWEEER